MPRVSTSRRIAALLTAALVSVLLVAVGGAARSTPHRTTVGSGHVATASPAARATHAAPGQHVQQHLHLDLALAPADVSSPTDARTPAVEALPDPRIDRDLVTPTGRAPPAL